MKRYLRKAACAFACAFVMHGAQAKTPPAQIVVKKDETVSGEFLYWFVNASFKPSPQKPLPVPRPDGLITLQIPAGFNQSGAQLEVLNVKTRRIAHLPAKSLRTSQPLARLLSAADFSYVAAMLVSVVYRGEAIKDAVVTLEYPDGRSSEDRVSPVDRGIARFSDVPLNENLTLFVANGGRTQQVVRSLSPSSPRPLIEIAVPERWRDVQTWPGRRPAAAAIRPPGSPGVPPFLGQWESHVNARGQRFAFVFRPDRTGALQVTTLNRAQTAPVSSAFHWLLVEDGRHIVLGTTVYSWYVVGAGADRKLMLVNGAGNSYELYTQ